MSELVRAGTAELENLAAEINAEHRACEAAVASAVNHAVSAGEMLLEVKQSLRHGGWLKWLDANFSGSRRHAQRYMQLASYRERVNATRMSHLESQSSITGALRAIQSEEAKEKAVQREARRAEFAKQSENYDRDEDACWTPLEVMWPSPQSWLESEAQGPRDYEHKKMREAIKGFTHTSEAPPEVLAVDGAPEVLELLKGAKKEAARILRDAVKEAEEVISEAAWQVEVTSYGAPTTKFPFGNPGPEHKKRLHEINEAQKRTWFAKHPDGKCRCYERNPGHWSKWGDNL